MKFRKKTAKFLLAAMLCSVIGIFATGEVIPVVAAQTQEDGSKEVSKEITCVDDIPGHKIGVQLGTVGDTYASDYEKSGEAEVVRYSKGSEAVLALVQGKVDCVIIDEQPAISFVNANEGLKILDEEFATEEYAICLAKGNDELKNELDDALSQLKSDGTLQNIIDYYIGNENGNVKRYEKKDVKRNGKLVMATNAEFPPYESRSSEGEVIGIDADVAAAMCDILGKELVIDDIAFDSIIPAVQSGKADFGLAGMTVTPDRLKNINFTQSYTTSKQVIIVRDKKIIEDNKKQTLIDKFKNDFIKESRWKNLARGLGRTLVITIFAAIIGIIIGFIIAIIRSNYDKTGKLPILNFLARVYLTVIRGTPTVVQLLIIYYVVFASVNVNKMLVAILAFGINSGAYVAEIVRSGIMSTPVGQMEAGRSLGLSYGQTMKHIIMPQAFKNVLPALGNEFIVLLKETSVSGYIGLSDLTRGGDTIRSITFDAMLPLLAVALCYLIMVVILSSLVNRLERRLRKSER